MVGISFLLSKRGFFLVIFKDKWHGGGGGGWQTLNYEKYFKFLGK